MNNIELRNLDSITNLNIVEESSIDLLWTDPPYNIGISEWDKLGNSNDYEKWLIS